MQLDVYEPQKPFNENQDDDEDDSEADGKVAGRNEDLRRKILNVKSKEIAKEEMEEIAKSSRLREVYHYRDWYQDEDSDNYLVFYNGSSDRYIEPGKQIYFSYGRRSNSYLLQ